MSRQLPKAMPSARWYRYLDFLRAHPYREENGIAYLEAGRGPVTLLFLHGTLGAGDIWWQQIDAFARTGKYRVIAPTYPRIRGLKDLAERIMAFMDAREVDRFVPIGASAGGFLAQYLVARWPKRIRAAVFSHTLPPYLSIVGRIWLQVAYYRLLPEKKLVGRLKRFVHGVLWPSEAADPLVWQYLMENVEKLGKEGFLNRYRILLTPFRAPEPEVPHMVVIGNFDPLIPRAVNDRMKETYPGARVFTFKGGGHFPYLHEPQNYNFALNRFFEDFGIDPSPPSST